MNVTPPEPTRSATVAALATGPGPGAIGVIEVCGPDARAAVAALFRPRRAGADLASGDLVYGILSDGPRPIDEVFVCFRAASRAWTGEETVEVHCHGGPAVLDAALEALDRRGARRARSAELAERAVRNGRLDRVRQEALERLAAARTPLAARVLLDQFHGALSKALRRLIEIPPDSRGPGEELDTILQTAAFGLVLSDPTRIVLAGAANAGKSTLFNALVGADRAIVHPTPGTTRDPVSDLIAPSGIPIRLVDTAGLPAPSPSILETAGFKATERALETADAVLVIVDAAAPPPPGVRELAAGLACPHAWVFNKIDLLDGAVREALALPLSRPPFLISAREGHGVAELALALPGLAGIPPAPPPGSACVFTARQRDALAAARAALPDARAAKALLEEIVGKA